MSTYWVERREVGHPRYRVWRKGPTFAAMLAPEYFGDRTEVRLEGKFLTRRGAERYIASLTWKRLENAQKAAQGSNRRSVALGDAETANGAQKSAPPFRPDPALIDNAEGNQRILHSDRAAAERYLRESDTPAGASAEGAGQ